MSAEWSDQVDFGSTICWYRVLVNEDALVIWLEDRRTQAQWQTAKLRIEDMETTNGKLPIDLACYAQWFASCLEGSMRRSKPRCELTSPSKDGSCRLLLRITATIGELEKPLRYSFHLMPLVLKREDVLEASVRELKAELACLHERNQVTQRNILQRSEAILAALNRTSPPHPGQTQAADTDFDWCFI